MSWTWNQTKPNREKTLEELQREYYETAIAANKAAIAETQRRNMEAINERNARQSEKYRRQHELHNMYQAELNHLTYTTGKPTTDFTFGNDKYSI